MTKFLYSVDAIVCVDACFTQKRRKSHGHAWVPPRSHPETIFVPRDEVDTMAEFVDGVRPSERSRRAPMPHPSSLGAGVEPEYEIGMRVPITVLNECNDSFVAANEKRVKASTQFFSDTALMAMLCRHDRVLWLVNMTSAGEKQHYVLSLVQKLFDHIPATMRIGLLYDIGCQLHRSCVKFNFLDAYVDRIVFGISVFHAYGHQWPCQLVYHPRKCKGFGLSDGEGCERFWKAIKALIPSCRVSGYYNRIYTIDTQVKHIDEQSLMGLGNWLRKKWMAMFSKRCDALEVLDRLEMSGYSVAFLDSQWKIQVMEQTKPLIRQSKSVADKAIDEILVLMRNVEDYGKEIQKLETMVEEAEYPEGMDIYMVDESLVDLRVRLQKAKTAIANKQSKLGVDKRLALRNLLGNDFLRLRLNALAIKQRIRDRLRQRKFELENLERAYRSTVNQLKLSQHAEQQIKRKEPGIQSLAKNYNRMCIELKELIAKNQAPRGAVAPLAMETTGLFKLDVDDDIWQDIGLTGDNDGDDQVPPWLGVEDVCEGIKSLLLYYRCLEEEQRLIAERISMQQWMQEEWATMLLALEATTTHPDIHFQILDRKKHLIRLCLNWKPLVSAIPAQTDDSWGPNEEDLAWGKNVEFHESVADKEDKDEDRNSEDEDEEDWIGEDEDYDAELLDQIETSARADQF